MSDVMGERTAAGRKYRPIPAPAIIDGVEWKVRESPGDRIAYVDFRKKTMVVPMSETPVGNMIRAHETTHVAITPAKEFTKAAKSGMSMRSINAAEDCRVYSAMKKAGVDCSPSHWPDEDIDKVKRSSELEQLRTLVAVRGTGDEEKIAAVVSDNVKRAASELVAEYFETFERRGQLPPWESTLSMANGFKDALKSDEEDAPSPPNNGGEKGEKSKGAGDGDPMDGDMEQSDDESDDTTDEEGEGNSDSESDKENDKESEEETPGNSGNEIPDKEDDEIGQPFRPAGSEIDKDQLMRNPTKGEQERLKRNLGERMAMHHDNGRLVSHVDKMEILKPKLTAKLPAVKLEGYRKRSSDMGAVPRNMHRRTIDNAVFSNRVRRGSASILFDVSGSMSISPEEIMETIKRCPTAILAIYSGCGGRGTMVIVAENGRCVKEIDYNWQKGGNTVDYLGLQWLARQKGPRYWISDGMATGQNDHLLDLEGCMEICKVMEGAQIKRIESWQKLMETGDFAIAEKKTYLR